METYGAAEAQGVGAIGVDGGLVDAAHLRHAANVLDRAHSPSAEPPAE
jgi:citrate lyase subunit beta/citryl-CoA lyase